jgi:hypothetical protein
LDRTLLSGEKEVLDKTLWLVGWEVLDRILAAGEGAVSDSRLWLGEQEEIASRRPWARAEKQVVRRQGGLCERELGQVAANRLSGLGGAQE